MLNAEEDGPDERPPDNPIAAAARGIIDRLLDRHFRVVRLRLAPHAEPMIRWRAGSASAP